MYTNKLARANVSSTQKIARKHVRMHLKRLRQREYARLRTMLPKLSDRKQVKKVIVIEEAVKYIDELHRALAGKLQCMGVPNTENLSEDDLKRFIVGLMPPGLLKIKSEQQVGRYEKQQKVPTYLSQSYPKSRRS